LGTLRQIARRDYMPELAAAQTLTAKRYDAINAMFVQRFGPYAGWAFITLFAAELALFKPRFKPNKPTTPSAHPRKRRRSDDDVSTPVTVSPFFFTPPSQAVLSPGTPPTPKLTCPRNLFGAFSFQRNPRCATLLSAATSCKETE
jgi:hypothetical protein